MTKLCNVCNKKLGLTVGRVKLSDGLICAKCWNKAGFTMLASDLSKKLEHSSLSIKKIINTKEINKSKIENFVGNRKVGNFLDFSDDTQTFVVKTINGFNVSKDLYEYNQILSFELLEDGSSLTKGGLGRAVVGGALLGGVGAIVGGVTGGKKTKPICDSLSIKITLRNSPRNNTYIKLIATKTKKSSTVYKTCFQLAQDALSALQIACDQTQESPASKENSFSDADELIKFTKLLNDGFITQEEFDLKKKQILGL